MNQRGAGQYNSHEDKEMSLQCCPLILLFWVLVFVCVLLTLISLHVCPLSLLFITVHTSGSLPLAHVDLVSLCTSWPLRLVCRGIVKNALQNPMTVLLAGMSVQFSNVIRQNRPTMMQEVCHHFSVWITAQPFQELINRHFGNIVSEFSIFGTSQLNLKFRKSPDGSPAAAQGHRFCSHHYNTLVVLWHWVFNF